MLVAVGVPLLFPDGRLPSPRWRPALWLALLATALNSLNLAISPGPLDASLPEVANPFALSLGQPGAANHRAARRCACAGSMIGGIAAQVVRFRRGAARGAAADRVVCLCDHAAAAGPGDPGRPGLPRLYEDTLLSGALLALAYPLLAAAVGVAVLRYRLYNIDLLISRTLVYGALTVCIITIYVLVVGYLGTLVQGGDNLLVSLIATGLVAILFQPLSAWLRRRRQPAALWLPQRAVYRADRALASGCAMRSSQTRCCPRWWQPCAMPCACPMSRWRCGATMRWWWWHPMVWRRASRCGCPWHTRARLSASCWSARASPARPGRPRPAPAGGSRPPGWRGGA